MSRNLSSALLCGAFCITAAACKKEEPPPPPPPAAPRVEKPRPPEHRAAPGAGDTACLGPFKADDPAPTALKINGRDWKLGASRAVCETRDADDAAVIGVLSEVNEDTGENMLNLGKYLDWFKTEKVELIVVNGDTGEVQSGIERVLARLADSKLPVLVVIGNREPKTALNGALEAVARKHPNVINGDAVRLLDYDDADLATLPGYYDKRFIHSPDGCWYGAEDIEALKATLAAANDPLVLVSHGPPHQEGEAALDYAGNAGNVGDEALADLIKGANVKFGLFANIKEAGGRATDLSGRTLIPQDTPADALYLNGGPADSSVRWPMNDGTESQGMAAVLKIAGGKASYKSYRAVPLTAAEQKLAAKLEPPQQ